MSNIHYDHSNYPQTGAFGASDAMRTEFQTIEAGFDSVDATMATKAELQAAIDSGLGGGGGGTGGDLSNYQPKAVILTALSALVTAANKLIYATGSGTVSVTDFTAFARTLVAAADAAAARSTLGLVIGQNVQAFDTELAALATLNSAADQLPYFTGAGTAATTTLTAFARSLLNDATAAEMKTTLGIVDSVSSDPELSAISSLTSSANTFPYFTGSGTASLANLSVFARSFLDDADAATARATLGLGTAATSNTTAFATSGDISTLQSSITATNSNVSSLASTVSGKANQSDLNTTNSNVSALSTTVAGKANNANPSTSGTHTHAGSLAFTGTGNRITGDFSNATIASRILFQTSTTNSNTSIGVIPNGSGNGSGLNAYSSQDANNSSIGQLGSFSSEVAIRATRSGTGAFTPFNVYTSDVLRMAMLTTGEFSLKRRDATNGAAMQYDKADATLAYSSYVGTGATPSLILQNAGGLGVQLVWGATAWTGISDENKKDIIEHITNGLEKVNSLRAVIGKYKTDEEGVRRSFLIAQDVKAVLPEAVDTLDDDKLGLRYTDVIPLLVSAFHDVYSELQSNRRRLEAIEALLNIN